MCRNGEIVKIRNEKSTKSFGEIEKRERVLSKTDSTDEIQSTRKEGSSV